MAIDNSSTAGAPVTRSTGGSATVRSGFKKDAGSNYVGKTVAEVRASSKQLGLSAEMVAYKGAEKLADDYVIQDTDNIEYIRKTGEKGLLTSSF